MTLRVCKMINSVGEKENKTSATQINFISGIFLKSLLFCESLDILGVTFGRQTVI